jgi:hypothetical protein
MENISQLSPLYQLRTKRQPLRTISLAAPDWRISLLDSIDAGMSLFGPSAILVTIISEIVARTFVGDMSGIGPDPLTPLTALFCNLTFNRHQIQPMLTNLINVVVPDIFDSQCRSISDLGTASSSLVGRKLGQILLESLKICQSLRGESAMARATGDLASELSYQLAGAASAAKLKGVRKIKRAKME